MLLRLICAILSWLAPSWGERTPVVYDAMDSRPHLFAGGSGLL
jgi:hypothetical protein